jgi:pimeloyl-ACP methyl ester carboxylesterase
VTTPTAARLHATELGDHGSRVVFLHGLFGQGKNWTTVAKALATDHRVLLLDLPDHGRSPWTEHVSYPGMAAAVARELRARAPGDRWAVVGHSMGGKVAMMLTLTEPDLVERLYVVDMAPVRYAEIGQGPYVAAMRAVDLDLLTDRRQADEQLRSPVPDPMVRGFLLQNLRRTRDPGSGRDRWQWQHHLAVLGDELDRLADWPDPQRPPYPGPVLWVAGADSDYVPPDAVAPMRALFPRARLVTVKRAGHWVHAEQPEIFTATVRAFLGEAPT